MAKRVEITIDGPVAEVALSRPEKMNALDQAMFQEIAEAGAQLKGVRGLRAVVLHGRGGNFCAGIDTASFPEMIAQIETIRAQMLEPAPGEVANRFQKPAHVWQELPVPVVAALEGVVFGGGAQIALGADFRIAAPGMRFSIMEAKWGLIPDMGLTQSLPRLLRADQAKELMMTARILEAEEALTLGLITRIADDPLAAARDLAAELATRSPEVLAGCKRLVEEAWCAPPETGLRLEAALQAEIIGSPNQIEAVMANLQKRAPKFT